MRLRHRLALTFTSATSLTVASAFVLTFAFFKHTQNEQLDHALFARARVEAEEAGVTGKLHIEQEPSGAAAGLSDLVKYGALYANDGTLLDSTSTFGQAPPFESFQRKSTQGFDFEHRGQRLRGAVIHIGPTNTNGAWLLLAVPLGEADSDSRHLVAVMTAVLVASAAISLALGWFGGVQTSRGIEAIASVARRVAQGEMGARTNKNEVGSVTEVRSLASDLDQMVGQLSALLDSERRFASNAAHELRSPLTALRGELELAVRRPRTAEEYRTAIAEALDSTERLIGLSENLLTLAKASRETPRFSQICLRTVLLDAVRASLARADTRRTVDVEAESDWMIEGDHASLVGMVRNLIDNAVAHAPEQTCVRVIARQSNAAHAVDLLVEDDGEGIPIDNRDRVFEPFFRGDVERQRSGAGLGLAIAREIARAHRGVLVLDNPRDPTRFRITLPEALKAQSTD